MRLDSKDISLHFVWQNRSRSWPGVTAATMPLLECCAGRVVVFKNILSRDEHSSFTILIVWLSVEV